MQLANLLGVITCGVFVVSGHPPRMTSGGTDIDNDQIWIQPPVGSSIGRALQPPRRENENLASSNRESWESDRPHGPTVGKPENVIQPPRWEYSDNQEIWIPPPGGRPIGNIVQPPRRENGNDGIWIPPPGGRPIGNIVQPPRRENEISTSEYQEAHSFAPNRRPGNIIQPRRRMEYSGDQDIWISPPGGRPIGNIVQPPRRENGNENDGVWIPPPGGRPIGNIVQPPRRENGNENDGVWIPPPGGRPVFGNIVQLPRPENDGNIIQPVTRNENNKKPAIVQLVKNY